MSTYLSFDTLGDLAVDSSYSRITNGWLEEILLGSGNEGATEDVGTTQLDVDIALAQLQFGQGNLEQACNITDCASSTNGCIHVSFSGGSDQNGLGSSNLFGEENR